MTNKERMSQIGEVMDELVKLGFIREIANYELEEGGYALIEHFISTKTYIYYDEELNESYTGKFGIAFHAELYILFIVGADLQIDLFGSLDDLLNKIKELINHD